MHSTRILLGFYPIIIFLNRNRMNSDSLIYTEHRLYCPCPINDPNCKKGYMYWTHATDGGSTIVSNAGYLRCGRCNKTANLLDWEYDCGIHLHHKADAQSLCYALTTMLQISGVEPIWIKGLTENIWKQAGIK